MSARKTTAAWRHMEKVASTGCVICRRDLGVRTHGQVHHIADGSNPRDDFMTACLCHEHHQGALGVHGLGVKAFCRMFYLPNEFYLLALTNYFIEIDAARCLD